MLAYLFSRYPVVSQTFCDSEMLALEALGVPLAVGSINPPLDHFRHPRLAQRKAPVFYPPPAKALESLRRAAEADGSWAPLAELIAQHDAAYGEHFKAATRARNALYFGNVFKEIGVSHVHVHFANRATHTALFMKKMGIPFSFTAHAQDFMVDLGSDELLREMAREAQFVAGVSEFSCELLREKCPDSAGRIRRVYNGLDPAAFTPADAGAGGEALKILSVGRLIEFKGFHHLINACAQLKRRGIAFELSIVGEGPWRERLQSLALEQDVGKEVRFTGVLGGDAVGQLLAASNVFALGAVVDSKGASDILPTVIAEAMAAGLPVVATRLAGIPEMVEHGKSGLLCEPGNEVELAGALARLAGEPDTRAAFARAGRRLAGERFALEVTAGQLLGAFPGNVREPARLPGLVYLASGWGECGPRSADPELIAAAAQDGVLPMVLGLHEDFRVSCPVAPRGLQFVPDELVLDAAWRADAKRAEEAKGLTDDLEQARIAVYLVEFLQRIGARRLHAARSDVIDIAWLVARLMDIEASCCMEEGGSTNRDLPVMEGLDLSIRKTRRKFGPFRFRIKPDPISPAAATAFIRSLNTAG
ncbi:MAG: glycosyltransferase family 4 protein [Verrucomicrobiales bacterium]